MIGLWGAVGNQSAQLPYVANHGHGLLQITAGPVVGDYNNDGRVDASDYVDVAPPIGGTSITNRDPNNAGMVGQADYNSWRTHVGQTAGGGVGTGSGADIIAIAAPNLPHSYFSCSAQQVGVVGGTVIDVDGR